MNHELLKRAIEIIREIPERQFDLRLFQWARLDDGSYVTELENADCDTLACAGGWLALHPDMHKAGLYTDPKSGVPAFDMGAEDMLVGMDSLAAFFDISLCEAGALFDPRQSFEDAYFGPETTFSDRQLWLRRMESFTASRQRFRDFFITRISGSTP